MNRTLEAARKFIEPDESVAGLEQYGHGIIHDTYLVKLNRAEGKFILQRLNTRVFTYPAAIMHNLKAVSEHIDKRLRMSGWRVAEEWQTLRIIPANNGRSFYLDAEGDFWRALNFIRDAVPLERISSLNEVREVGRALAVFHWLTADLDPEVLQEALPGFHNVELYLKHFDEVVEGMDKSGRMNEFCQNFIAARRDWSPVLEIAHRNKDLPHRVIHGDPKIDNMMLDSRTGKAVSIIDLDTVMPGPVHYDLGDALRSCCNIVDENAADPTRVRFDLERCEAFLDGYMGTGLKTLYSRDFDFFFDAVRLVPFELGLRFYTDFLEDNRYFKVSRKDQNLVRAIVQFRLAQSIEAQEEKLKRLFEKFRADSK